MCDGQLKGKFVSKNVINLSKRNLSENEISLLSKGLYFIPTCSKVDVARLKLELEQFGLMLRLKWYFRNDKRDIPINPFKAKSTFNPRYKDAAIEIYLSSLEEKLLKTEVPKDKFNNLTRGEWDALYNLKNDKTIVIKGADKGSVMMMFDIYDCIHTHFGPPALKRSLKHLDNGPSDNHYIIQSTDWLVATTDTSSKVRNLCTSSVKPTAQYCISNHQSRQL